MNEIKEGEVVQLKSGGPLMTVVSVTGNIVRVVWFANDTTTEFKEFYDYLLIKRTPR